jgi:UDP:flavonoid glycosyltransferase YjiC (YdhE family)
VLDEAELVVCHGGSGTLFGALAAGVPVVVVPLFADQFENGRRVAGCGAGLVIEPEHEDANGPRRVIGDEDAPRIVDAINAVLGTASYGRNARRIALEMAAAPTVDQVLEALLGGRIEGMR